MEDLRLVKRRLYEYCQQLVSDQIASAQAELKKLQVMEGEETKSSAGDKYETSRAMLFLEKEKIAGRLAEAHKKQKALSQLSVGKTSETIAIGSLVKTDKGLFFIATSLGRLVVEGAEAYAISPVSPIGRALSSKKQGQQATFNTTTYEIMAVV